MEAGPTTNRRKLLILALGGLLCDRVLRRENQNRLVAATRPHDAAYGSFVVYKRPHCQEFLKFCFERFDVAFWTAAKRWYTDNALDCVMNGLKKSDIMFAWNQDRCNDSGFKTLNKTDKPLFLKELKTVLDNLFMVRNASYLALNTVMIEDEPYKTLLNPPNTAVFTTEYKFENMSDNVLAPGGELWMFLDGLARAGDDVPSYVKAHPFGKPAITPAHSDWAYYKKIIQAHGGSC
ncbi:unnamed protein product [Linum trigynum]|uniref:Mitochondrial import inner membrane translocase subunit TIM50 n=1 Tax=Linum trigynum TaxID=586398 RepID=A0AAV2DI64_9ROSI